MERGLREISHDVSIINNWSTSNGNLNAKKTQVLVCGKRRLVRQVREALFHQSLNLFFGTDRLLAINKVKNMRVHHVNHSLQQVYCILRQLYHFNNILHVRNVSFSMKQL
jgi:hypothetical protein